MTDPSDELDTLRGRIRSADAIAEADRDALLELDRTLQLLNSEYSDHRRLKLLRHVTILAEEVGGVAAALDDRDAAEELVRWIHTNRTNEETNRDYRVALRVFGRRVTDGDETPDALAWISSSTSSNYDPAPEPGEMLDWEDDVLPMIDEARNARDAAALALQFDAGLRGGEFEALTVGDVTDHKHGLQVTVNGKQGKRTVTLILAVPHVQRWLSDHPVPTDGDAPLWSKLSAPEPLSYKMITKMFGSPAERAGVTKPVTPTNFRKSSASYLASRGMRQPHLEDHHGWVRGSSVAARYVSVFSEDADRELARVHGKDVETTEPDPTAPVECPRCGEDTPRERDLCVWCGQALAPDAARKAEHLEDLIVESLAEADGEDAERLLDFRNAAKDNPQLRAEAIDEIAGLLDGEH
ncbi:tyrosine-type recombinase/integrase [Halorubrum sp. DTA98]|uniref:tyrosine-type recombinase/integrase n=1 Tax=Halorubrum sp. DTA98 TaxID=3402163 RepID=UPI003AACF674